MDAWALISVSDKTGLAPLAQYLTGQGLRLLATSSTARHLSSLGLEVQPVEALTGFEEILEGRVKTLHPMIYAGLLASSSAAHQAQRIKLGAPDIRVAVVNLYPFEQRWQEHPGRGQLIEEIDIGGVSLIRAAAKNYSRVAVLVSPAQYEEFMARPVDDYDIGFRRHLAVEAFRHVAYYDAIIATALSEDRPGTWPDTLVLAGTRQGSLRYGENPHQSGAFYRTAPPTGLARAQVLQGKELSYNNLADADTAVRLAFDFVDPAAVVVKHQTPCAAAVGQNVEQAYVRAHDADPVSIFGGIVAVNRELGRSLAERLSSLFLEVVIAPDVTPEARVVFAKKKNLRVLVVPHQGVVNFDLKGIWGGFLIQPSDTFVAAPKSWNHVAGPALSEGLEPDLVLAWKTVARTKSNAIVVARDGVTVGVASGETNRIDAARHALERAGQRARGAVMASDGFFPFDDVMRLAQECGIAAVVQPGGSMRDDESITVAEQAGVTLLMTGERHFRH